MTQQQEHTLELGNLTTQQLLVGYRRLRQARSYPEFLEEAEAYLKEADKRDAQLAAATAEVERLRTMCQLWKAAAKRKRQHHDNALAALAHNINVNNAQGQEIKRLHRQLEDAQVARRYVPVEHNTFVQGKTSPKGEGIVCRKMGDLTEFCTTEYDLDDDERKLQQLMVFVPGDYWLCRLAPQQEEGGRC